MPARTYRDAVESTRAYEPQKPSVRPPYPTSVRLPPSLATVHEMSPGTFVQYYSDRAPPQMDSLLFIVEQLFLPEGILEISGAGNRFFARLDDLRVSNLKIYKIKVSAAHPENRYVSYRKVDKGLFSTPFFETPVSLDEPDKQKMVRRVSMSELDMHTWNVQSVFRMRELVEEPMFDIDLRHFHALPSSLRTRVLNHATVELKCALLAVEYCKRALAERDDLLPWHECARFHVRTFLQTVNRMTSMGHIVKCMLDVGANNALTVMTEDALVAMAHQFDGGRIPSGFIGLFVLTGVRFPCNMDAVRISRGNVVAARDINAGEVVALHGNNVLFPARCAPGGGPPPLSTDWQLCDKWKELLRTGQRAKFDACVAKYVAPSIPVRGAVLNIAGSPLPDNSNERVWLGHMVNPPPPRETANAFRMPGLCKIVTGVVSARNIACGEYIYAAPTYAHAVRGPDAC